MNEVCSKGKIKREWNGQKNPVLVILYKDSYIIWEICMQVKKQQLKLDMEQCTGSKLGKEYVKAVYCHPAY